jgi:hypothetical protein
MKFKVNRNLCEASGLVAYNCTLHYTYSTQTSGDMVDNKMSKFNFIMLAPTTWNAPEDGDLYDFNQLFDDKIFIPEVQGTIKLNYDDTDENYNTLTYRLITAITDSTTEPDKKSIVATIDNVKHYITTSVADVTITKDNFYNCEVKLQKQLGFVR